MRKLRQWWPVILAVLFLVGCLAVVVTLAFGILSAGSGLPISGTWQIAGLDEITVAISKSNGDIELRFAQDGAWQATVPARVAFDGTAIEATLPADVSAALLRSAGRSPIDGGAVGRIQSTGDVGRAELSLLTSSESFTIDLRSAPPPLRERWVPLVMLVSASLLLLAALFGSGGC